MDDDLEAGTSTVPEAADERAERRGLWIRRATLTALTVFVLLGATGQLGVRSGTASASDGALTATLTYPHVARPALAVPYHLVIHLDAPPQDQIEVRISSRFIDSFDENGRSPEPAESSTDGDEVIWTFDPPDGDTLTVSLDTRVEPGVQWRRTGTTSVTVGDDSVSLDHTMWVLP
ncbi:MAG TPA: hypothetical protein VEW93_07780 [Acidimicrobiales bacterium]|nr:hypothetical protein [Acidimicrobiales bacterium]